MPFHLTDHDVLELTGVLDHLQRGDRHVDHHPVLDLPVPEEALAALTTLFGASCAGVYSLHLTSGKHYFSQYFEDGRTEQPDDEWDLRMSPDYWKVGCSAAERTGDFDTVWDDALSEATFDTARARQRARDLFRVWFPEEPGHDLGCSSLVENGQQLRIIVWRDQPWEDRDHLLLRLLRPHVVEATRDWRLRNPPDLELTDRQREILLRVRDGLSNAQIARRMDISEGTVRTHLNHIFLRLGASSRTDAVRKAFDVAQPVVHRPDQEAPS